MIEFPCDFPIKIIFKNEPGAADELLTIVRRHHPNLASDAIKQQSSKLENYASITATVEAQNQDSLDLLYRELTKHVHVKMVL